MSPDERMMLDMIKSSGLLKKLRQEGTGRWRSLCPYHEETRPSFLLREDRMTFTCFGCGAWGHISELCVHLGLPLPEGFSRADILTDRIVRELQTSNGKDADPDSAELGIRFGFWFRRMKDKMRQGLLQCCAETFDAFWFQGHDKDAAHYLEGLKSREPGRSLGQSSGEGYM